jgi:hypothetical protein
MVHCFSLCRATSPPPPRKKEQDEVNATFRELLITVTATTITRKICLFPSPTCVCVISYASFFFLYSLLPTLRLSLLFLAVFVGLSPVAAFHNFPLCTLTHAHPTSRFHSLNLISLHTQQRAIEKKKSATRGTSRLLQQDHLPSTLTRHAHPRPHKVATANTVATSLFPSFHIALEKSQTPSPSTHTNV